MGLTKYQVKATHHSRSGQSGCKSNWYATSAFARRSHIFGPSDLSLKNVSNAANRALISLTTYAFISLSSGGSVNSLLTLDPATGQALASVPFSEQHRFGDLASPRCTDLDGDGFSPEGGSCGPVDCDDNDRHIHPGAFEVCNGVDDNCDGIVDEEPAASASCAFSGDSHDEELSASPRHDDDR